MSAPDIGTLRALGHAMAPGADADAPPDTILAQIDGLAAGLVAAQREATRCRDGLVTLVSRAIRSAFGEHPGEWVAAIHPGLGVQVGYDYRPDGGWWGRCVVAAPAAVRPADDGHEVRVYADTPTAAVHKALDALAETHPTEAELLRKAVTFKGAP